MGMAAQTAHATQPGVLVKFGQNKANVAFLSGTSKKHFILVGGLGDGFLFAPYGTLLERHLVAAGWSLVQPLLSSSYNGWGVGSLDQDADELLQLTTYLKEQLQSEGFVLMGHSTGCQDAVRYAQRHLSDPQAVKALAIILQAPVSDRECQGMDPETNKRLDAANLMVQNKEGEQILYRQEEDGKLGAPVCARRFVSLAGYNGDDDIFSSDFTDAELRERLAPCGAVPCLVMMSGADQYMPVTLDKARLASRLSSAIGQSAKSVVIHGGKHNLEGSEDEVVRLVNGFVAAL